MYSYIEDNTVVVINNPCYDSYGSVGIWTNPPRGWETGEVNCGGSCVRALPSDVRRLRWNDKLDMSEE